ncbi:hypothetical protein [Cryobacterium sp. PAMC25264]|uniref:hypothetical protein n=1 Tax=Cryobacterium sp. PAMC25264 TaxID=2861288 RepID=UPI001C627866|nr:hypothetical protein [Cryobacterium sp. PAMC25264]QYF74763.1 hypothetical protein KY500_06275 [Cryobacterium sp. PAMC25264]
MTSEQATGATSSPGQTSGGQPSAAQPTSGEPGTGEPRASVPNTGGPGFGEPGAGGPASASTPATPGSSPWRHQAGLLGAAFAVAAAVIAAGLRFAPQVSAYAGLSPWVFAGLLGFVLVLAGACVLFAASLPNAPSSGHAHDENRMPAGRGLTILGAVLGLVGLALAALAVLLAVVLPAPTQRIMVQFTDLYGRVQLEYCPTLPGSFEATASQADLVGSSTILPVKVSGATCGDPEYTDGVWIYLNRDSVTVSDRP